MTDSLRLGARRTLRSVYHDTEWGVPVHDDRALFEFLILEGAQAGLSWTTDPEEARKLPRRVRRLRRANAWPPYDDRKVAQLARQPRHRAQPAEDRAAIRNAQRFLAVQKEFGSFDAYVWQFVGGQPTVESPAGSRTKFPPRRRESDAMSKDLLQRGFKFVGSTICYAFMQAVGMVNDHAVTAVLPLHAARTSIKPRPRKRPIEIPPLRNHQPLRNLACRRRVRELRTPDGPGSTSGGSR